MSKQVTTKDLMALNELMTFENWMALKLLNYSKETTSTNLKNEFKKMAKIHAMNHKNLLNYLSNA